MTIHHTSRYALSLLMLLSLVRFGFASEVSPDMMPSDDDLTLESPEVLRRRKSTSFCRLCVQVLKANTICAGSVSVRGPLNVGGNATFANDVSIGGNLDVSGTISGNINPASLCQNGALNLPCNLNVAGNITATGTITGAGGAGPSFNPCAGGTFNIPCATNIGGALTVSGPTTINNNLTVAGTINRVVRSDVTEQFLRAVRGTIEVGLGLGASLAPLGFTVTNPTVAVVAGDGFTATSNITAGAVVGNLAGIGLLGTVRVTFTTPFTSRPSIALGAEDVSGTTAGALDFRITNVSAAGFDIETISAVGIATTLAAFLNRVNFIAVGPE